MHVLSNWRDPEILSRDVRSFNKEQTILDEPSTFENRIIAKYSQVILIGTRCPASAQKTTTADFTDEFMG